MNVPRGTIKKTGLQVNVKASASLAKVAVNGNAPMAGNNFTQVLNVATAACGINESVLGDNIWFTLHCFRDGDVQYLLMFAP